MSSAARYAGVVPSSSPYDVVSKVPYAVTTPLLRTLLDEPGWEVAVLVQWEVARKHAGVRGATLLTASWWLWYDVTLPRRVLVPDAQRRAYQRLVRGVLTGRAAGLTGVLRPHLSRPAVRAWAARHGVGRAAPPWDLEARQWASRYRTARDGHG